MSDEKSKPGGGDPGGVDQEMPDPNAKPDPDAEKDAREAFEKKDK